MTLQKEDKDRWFEVKRRKCEVRDVATGKMKDLLFIHFVHLVTLDQAD